VSTTRAGFVAGAAGAGFAAAVLRPLGALAQGRRGDADILAYLLRVQELESALYREGLQAVPDLGTEGRRLVGELREHEVEHVDALRATLRDAGGRPDPRVAPAFGAALASREAFLKLANTLEDTVVSAHNGTVPLLSSADLRAAVVSIAQVEARHAALVRLARGRRPAPLAFDRESTSQRVRSAIRRLEQR